MSGRSCGGCVTRTRRCGWSGRSCQKQRSSSRRRATGDRRGVLVHRRGEGQLSRRCDVSRARRQPHQLSRLGASATVRPGADRRVADREDRTDPQANRGVYGAPRIHAELRLEHGIRVGRTRFPRLMKAAAIAGIRPRKRWRTTIRVPGVEPATDLVERDFRRDGPNVLWVADITYLRSGEGWLYLAAVQDTYSRQIVGWSMATHMRSALVVDALRMALGRRRPGPPF